MAMRFIDVSFTVCSIPRASAYRQPNGWRHLQFRAQTLGRSPRSPEWPLEGSYQGFREEGGNPIRAGLTVAEGKDRTRFCQAALEGESSLGGGFQQTVDMMRNYMLFGRLENLPHQLPSDAILRKRDQAVYHGPQFNRVP